MSAGRPRILRTALLAGVAASTFFVALPVIDAARMPALAQRSASASQIDFREALEPFGRWILHRRWGEVWMPAVSRRDWRPYEAGNWVYTDEWGWYWNADDEEDDWGWITYHYGRWTFDRSLGWIWIPGDEWAPAWVDWRRGDNFVGWAPLPPDEIIIDNDPIVWMFVALRDLTAPRVNRFFLPPRQRDSFYHRSVRVNRAFGVEGRKFGVNPGIPPSFVARASGKPVRTFQVNPRVFAGTSKFDGAIEIQPGDLRRDRGRSRLDRASIKETTVEINPVDKIPPPQALGRGEKGRFGERPPRAIQQSTAPSGAPALAPKDSTTPLPPPSSAGVDTKDPGPVGPGGRRGPPGKEEPVGLPPSPGVRPGSPPAAGLPPRQSVPPGFGTKEAPPPPPPAASKESLPPPPALKETPRLPPAAARPTAPQLPSVARPTPPQHPAMEKSAAPPPPPVVAKPSGPPPQQQAAPAGGPPPRGAPGKKPPPPGAAAEPPPK